MGSSLSAGLTSLAIVFASGFFVAGEYAILGSRRSRLEGLAKKGHRSASLVLQAMDQMQRYVAAVQVAITMCGVGIGSITEPFISEQLESLLAGRVAVVVSRTAAFIIAVYAMVVIGELVPKYIAIKDSERIALFCIRPLRWVVKILTPLAWLAEKSGSAVLRPFGIKTTEMKDDSVSREELLLLVRAGASGGEFDEAQSRLVQRALRFDALDAGDIMVHRMDIEWLDVSATREELTHRLQKNRHSRLVVCDGDIDNVVGILYLQDVLRIWGQEDWNLGPILRKPEFIPETLNLNRVVLRMQDAKTQILMIADEYGGTSGLITLEDVVEEVFGELDDQPETDRPAIEQLGPYRLSLRSDVRYDEILEYLQRESFDEDPVTDTVAQIVVERLDKLPKLGDKVEDPLGTFRVENMARRRVTRVVLQLEVPVTTATGAN